MTVVYPVTPGEDNDLWANLAAQALGGISGGTSFHPDSPATYVVWGAAPTVYVKATATGVVTEYATELAALEYCRDYGPALGTDIVIKPPFYALGNFGYTRPNITCRNEVIAKNPGVVPADQICYIEYITVENTTATQLWNQRLQGIFTQQIYFHNTNASGSISRFYGDDLRIYSTSTANHRGLIFDAEAGYIDHINLNRGVFAQASQAANHGFITKRDGGDVVCTDCWWQPEGDNLDFINIVAEANTGHTIFDNLIVAGMATFTGNNLINMEASAGGGRRGMWAFEFNGGYMEFAEDFTLIDIAASTAAMVCNISLVGVHFNVQSGVTVNLINNLNNSWDANWPSSVIFGKCLKEGVGTMAEGTPNQSANFNVDVDIAGFNPQAAWTGNVAASPATIGPFPYPVMYYVGGGTITSVTHRGQVSWQSGAGTAQTPYYMYPGDTVVVVWTVQPTEYGWPV